MNKTDKKSRLIRPTIEQWEDVIVPAAKKQGKSLSQFCIDAALKEARRVNK